MDNTEAVQKQKQHRGCTAKNSTKSPNLSIEAIILSCAADAKEARYKVVSSPV